MTALAPILEAFFTDRLMTQRDASMHSFAAALACSSLPLADRNVKY
jgi:hypothetical protein